MSLAVLIAPLRPRGAGRLLNAAAASLRALPVPVLGRIENGSLLLDLRCLVDVEGFVANLARLTSPEAGSELA